jgi:cysteinyl-tRNA synthetase
MMDIKIYNSLTNQVDEFKPIVPGVVSIYVCGPTVYNDAHIGNFRPTVFFDVFRRFLLYIGYKVNYVSNFTDVDDKIIKRALELNISEKELTDKMIVEYLKVCSNLNVLRATVNPRVTETMPEIIAFIDSLVKTNHAYISGNDVYFRVNSIPNYGVLSNIKVDELKAGARIEENDAKENPFDFTLWKKTNVGVTWDSPWGKGRPGWHTECVVMIEKYLGNQVDIHGGGFDLKFPHHENEIAQSRAHCDCGLANYWMHNGFLNINNEKMSKSLGNVITGKEAIQKFGGNLTRYILISTYYRSPINLTEEYINTSKIELEKIEKGLNDLAKRLQILNIFDKEGQPNVKDFLASLANDVNIANAKSSLFDLLKKINIDLRNPNVMEQDLLDDFASIKVMLDILGLKFDIIVFTKEDLDLLRQYNNAKANKDYVKSDELRAILISKNLL